MANKPNSVSVSADPAFDELGNSAVLIKIQSSEFELNIFVQTVEVPLLRSLPKWEAGSKRIGSSAGSPSFWSIDGENLSILVGPDNQSWDFGVSLGAAILEQIIQEVERASQSAA